MGMKKWSDWLDDVMPSLPGAQTNIVEAHIRNSAIEFCQRSRFLRATLDAINTVANEPLYDLTVDSQTTLVRIESASLDGKPIDPTSPDAQSAGNREWETESGDISAYLLVEPDQIRLVKIPAVGGQSLLVKVSMKPRQAATGIDSSVFEQYRDAIASGAMARMMAVPKKPWSAPTLVEFHKDQFETGLRSAQARATKAATSAPLRVKGW